MTLLDQARAGTVGAMVDPGTAEFAVAQSLCLTCAHHVHFPHQRSDSVHAWQEGPVCANAMLGQQVRVPDLVSRIDERIYRVSLGLGDRHGCCEIGVKGRCRHLRIVEWDMCEAVAGNLMSGGLRDVQSFRAKPAIHLTARLGLQEMGIPIGAAIRCFNHVGKVPGSFGLRQGEGADERKHREKEA